MERNVLSLQGHTYVNVQYANNTTTPPSPLFHPFTSSLAPTTLPLTTRTAPLIPPSPFHDPRTTIRHKGTVRLAEEAILSMTKWFEENKHHPYPNYGHFVTWAGLGHLDKEQSNRCRSQSLIEVKNE